MKFDAAFIACHESVRADYGDAVRGGEYMEGKKSTILLSAVLNDWKVFGVDGRKENGNLNLTVRGASTAYADMIGCDKGQISKCLTILFAFSDERSAGVSAVQMLVATHGPSLNDIYKAALALLNGDDEEEGDESPKTFESDCMPIVKRWARRGMTADEMTERFAALVADMMGDA